MNDAYDAEGHWSPAGFTLNKPVTTTGATVLPINADLIARALDNKEMLEVLKGASGMQAGTSSPWWPW